MRVIFKTIKIHNFLCFEDEKFSFDSLNGLIRVKGINLDNEDENGIYGKNGCGKSQLFYAIVYALYGEFPFSLGIKCIPNRYLDDKRTSVELSFSILNNSNNKEEKEKQYIVESGLIKGKSYCTLKEICDNNVEDITLSSMTETHKYIQDNIINCELEMFMRIVYLNTERTYNFYDLKPTDRKRFIDKLLGITIFEKTLKKIQEVKRTTSNNIKTNDLLLINKNNSIDINTLNRDDFEKLRNDKITDLTKKLEKEKKTIDIKEKEKSKLENEKNESNDKEELEKTNLTIKNELDSLIETKTKKNRLIEKYKIAIEGITNVINKHSDVHSKLCDDCKQIFSNYYKLDEYIEKNKELKPKLKTEENEFKETLDHIEEHKKKLRENEKKLENIENNIKTNKESLNKLESDIRILDTVINSYNSQIETQKSLTNTYGDIVNTLLSEKSKIEEDQNKLRKEQEYNNVIEIIFNQSDVKKNYIHDNMERLNKKLKENLRDVGFTNIDVIFNDDMTYSFVCPEKSSKPIEFNNFSKGEQARISIATCLTLRYFLSSKNGFTSNIFILDEYFDGGIDTVGVMKVMNKLKKIYASGHQNIYIVSHRSEVSDESFNHIIQLVKQNNISHIEKVK